MISIPILPFSNVINLPSTYYWSMRIIDLKLEYNFRHSHLTKLSFVWLVTLVTVVASEKHFVCHFMPFLSRTMWFYMSMFNAQTCCGCFNGKINTQLQQSTAVRIGLIRNRPNNVEWMAIVKSGANGKFSIQYIFKWVFDIRIELDLHLKNWFVFVNTVHGVKCVWNFFFFMATYRILRLLHNRSFHWLAQQKSIRSIVVISMQFDELNLDSLNRQWIYMMLVICSTRQFSPWI